MNYLKKNIEEMMSLGNVSAKDIFQICVPATTANLGIVFKMSYMTEKHLPEDAQHRQLFVDDIAKKNNCSVSYRLVYSTKGRTQDLLKTYREISKVMYVSPIFWIPIRRHWKTFGFGFLPYSSKTQFKYNPNANIPKIETDWNSFSFYGFDKSVEMLHNMVSMCIKNGTCIEIDKNSNTQNSEVYYSIVPITKEIFDDSKYPQTLTSQEYFNTIVNDYNVSDLVIPEYKMIIYQREECDYLNTNDEKMYNKLNVVRHLLSKRLNVTSARQIKFKGRIYKYFNYDDSELYYFSQYFRFFNFN